MKRWTIGLLLLLILSVVALVSFRYLFFYRDNFATHLPVKDLTAKILAAGELPLWNPQVGGGQPLAGNPNTLTFYPDTLLYLLLPSHVAFNLHFILHVLFGAWAMFILLRVRGISVRSAWTGTALYISSGVVVSSFAFYNLVTAIALVPLVFLLIERVVAEPSWRRGLALGAAAGLIGLAGEPVMVLAVGFACLVLLAGRVDGRHRVAFIVAIVVAILVASPLLVAWNEIRGQVERGVFGYSAATVLAASVSPERASEIVLGPFRGVLTDGSYVPAAGQKWPPFFLSLYVGALLLPALGMRSSGSWREKLIALALLGGLLGRFNPLVRAMAEGFPALRIVRYPEKLALPFTVVAIVLIAMLLDSGKRDRGETIVSVISLALLGFAGVGLFAGWIALPSAARERGLFGIGVAIATLLCALLRSRGRGWSIAMILLPGLLGAYWFVRTIPIDLAAPYIEPSIVARFLSGERIYRDRTTLPIAMEQPARNEYRDDRAFALNPSFGVLHNVAYAGEKSPDGMYSYLSRIVSERIESEPLSTRLRYLRIAGCREYVTAGELSGSGLSMREVASRTGHPVRIYSISNPLPSVMTPSQAVEARSVQHAVRTLESEAFDEQTTIVTSPGHALPFSAPAQIRDVVETSQGLTFHVSAGADTVVMVNQTYFVDAWDARAGDLSLATFPADLDRLGIEIPAGEWKVTVRFGRMRGWIVLLTLMSLSLMVFAMIMAGQPRVSPLPGGERRVE